MLPLQSMILRPRYGPQNDERLLAFTHIFCRENINIAGFRYQCDSGEKTRSLSVAVFTASLGSFAPKDAFVDPFSDDPALDSEINDPIEAIIPQVSTQTYTSCGNCKAAYTLTSEMLGPDGRRVKCAVCGNVWFQSPDKLNTLRAGFALEPFPVEQYKAGGMVRDSNARDGGGNRGPPAGGVLKHTRTGAVTLFVGNMPFSMSDDKIRYLPALIPPLSHPHPRRVPARPTLSRQSATVLRADPSPH